MISSPKIDIEMVPSPTTQEHPARGKDSLDRISILESLIAYSPEVEVISTKTVYERGGGDKVVSRDGNGKSDVMGCRDFG